MALGQINQCKKCNAPILPIIGRGLVLYTFGQTLGVKPRRKTSAEANVLCKQCAFFLSMRPDIDERDFFNRSAHQIMRKLTGIDREETQHVMSRMFDLVIEREGLIEDAELEQLLLPEPEYLPPVKTLKAAS